MNLPDFQAWTLGENIQEVESKSKKMDFVVSHGLTTGDVTTLVYALMKIALPLDFGTQLAEQYRPKQMACL